MDILYNTIIYYTIFNATYHISSYISYLIDTNYPPESIKIQETTPQEIQNTYTLAFPTVMFNTLIATIPSTILGGYYDTLPHDPYSIPLSLIHLLFIYIMVDPCLYITHRILHIPPIYKMFHKKHHKITKPVGFSSLYSTVFEVYFNNIIPIFLPLYFIYAHPITVKIWLIMAVVNTNIVAHSGFEKMGDYHDKHHEHFNYNYGTDVFMDKLMGTYK